MGFKEERLRRGLTQEACAILAGTDTATISRIERGLVRPRPETVVRLAQALGIGARRMEKLLSTSSEECDE